MKLENICRQDVRFAIRDTLDFRCIPQFHPKKNIVMSFLRTIIVEEVLEFHTRKDISVTVLSTVVLKEASVWHSLKDISILAICTLSCRRIPQLDVRKTVPISIPSAIFLQEEPLKQLGNGASF
jgi:hypothetical protein